ncbi:unnamed protein product [Owenia fusiformis]|uniref:Cytochrome P450 n=1 Tax=Owenia fusiformis TaxID=6347 RepID=A0A8S4PVE0_OWEFU|nr:unnamed protein product [Owenia fusiformis]
MDILMITIIGVLLFLGWWYVLLKPKSGLPPGLPRLPILGSLPLLDANDLLGSFLHLKKRFGDVFTVYMANRPVIYLNSYESIKEVLVQKGENFMQRPYFYLLTEALRDEGKDSFASSSGSEHKTIRHFTRKVLIRQFGMGTRNFQDKIIDELQVMFAEMDKNEGKPFDTLDLLGMSMSNMMNIVLYGKRMEYTDTLFLELRQRLEQTCIDIVDGQIINIFPWARHMPWKKHIIDNMAMRKVRQKEIMEQTLQRHAAGYEDVRDSFMQAWLDKMNEKTSSDPESVFNKVQMRLVMNDLFSGGTETSKGVMYITLAYMLRYPQLQAKIQASIDEHIGETQVPTIEDRKKIVLAEATILEVLRCHPALPLAMPHTNLHDDTINGYQIPAGTMVMPNIHAAHHDEKHWKDPFDFNPERFIDVDGQIDKVKSAFVIPFSMGKRVCPGEALAKMELFLTFTSLLQRYTFTVPPGEKLPSLKMNLGFTLSIPRYKLCATRRNSPGDK